jgi:hypothetical protein
LNDPKATKAEKEAAASALAQTPENRARQENTAAQEDGQVTDWYTAHANGEFGKDDVVEPPRPYADIFVTNSHKMAVACWRYIPQTLYYYRVRQYVDPTPVGDLPGLFQCHSAVVIEKVHDGSGFNTDAPPPARVADAEIGPSRPSSACRSFAPLGQHRLSSTPPARTLRPYRAF